MNIVGTMFLVDENHINILNDSLSTNPPPNGRIVPGSVICMDMDECNNDLELKFPNHCQKATLLCPPPIAMYKEIDGDKEGFIEEYNKYLNTENSVQEFIASMILFLHVGGNILLYTPSCLDDDTIWIATLAEFFRNRFGIGVGGPYNTFSYNSMYDTIISDFLYSYNMISVFEFIAMSTVLTNSKFLQNKLIKDLSLFTAPGENPLDLYNVIKSSSNPVCCKPIVFFD